MKFWGNQQEFWGKSKAESLGNHQETFGQSMGNPEEILHKSIGIHWCPLGTRKALFWNSWDLLRKSMGNPLGIHGKPLRIPQEMHWYSSGIDEESWENQGNPLEFLSTFVGTNLGISRKFKLFRESIGLP